MEEAPTQRAAPDAETSQVNAQQISELQVQLQQEKDKREKIYAAFADLRAKSNKLKEEASVRIKQAKGETAEKEQELVGGIVCPAMTLL